jgi:hypothetical protein
MRSYVHDPVSGSQLHGKATPQLTAAMRQSGAPYHLAYLNLDNDWMPCNSLEQAATLRDSGFDVREVWIFNKK